VPNPLQTTIGLIGIISIGGSAISSTLPCSAQTVIQPIIQLPTIVQQVTNISPSYPAPTEANSISQSNSLCFQIDADSRMYIRYKNGSSRSYVTDSSISYNQTMTRYPRCD
jgi:hypothetical protein